MSIRFCDVNYIDLDFLSNATVSSEQTAFPVNNVYNKQRRSKVWRSNGYWEIASGSNTIVFRETSAGPDLTATVAASTYTSTTSFLSAIKTAMDAAGASTYTMTQNSNFEIVFTSDGAGGAGDFELHWTNASSTAMAGILGFDTSADDTGALTYTADELKIHTDEWLKWDLGLVSNPTAFCLVGPRNQPLNISPSSTIKLQGNETDNWSSPSFEKTLTYNDNVIIEFDSTGLHTEALRYWRLSIVDQNPLGYVEIGNVFLGEFYATTTGKPQFPFQSVMIDRTSTLFSEGGQTFSDIREQSQQFNVAWFGLTKTELDRTIEVFEFFGIGTPLFVSFDPGAAYFLDENSGVRYVKFVEPPQFELVSPNNYRLVTRFREEL